MSSHATMSAKSALILEATLREAGIAPFDLDRIRVISWAPPDNEKNRLVYDATNRVLLKQLEKRGLGECIHITGEGRALADPNHRRVCRRSSTQYKNPFKIVCQFKPGSDLNSRNLMKWKRRDWGKDWKDCLDTFDLIGSGAMSFFALKREERVHYSLFADSFVLLQSVHQHGLPKYVWLLKSRELNKNLLPRARKIITESSRIPSNTFNDPMISISSPAALHVLSVLYEGPMSRRTALSRFSEVRTFDNSDLADLEAIGFVTETRDSIEITGDGREYLEFFDERQ